MTTWIGSFKLVGVHLFWKLIRFDFLIKTIREKVIKMFLLPIHNDIQAQSFPKYLIGFFDGRANRMLHRCGGSSWKKHLFLPLCQNVDCPMFPECATDYCSTRNSYSCLSKIGSWIFSLKVMNVSSKNCRILGATNHNRPHLDSRIKMLIVSTI